MNIVTIMNYDWKNDLDIDICIAWIKKALQNLSKFDSIYIVSKKVLPNFLIQNRIKNIIWPEFEISDSLHFGSSAGNCISNHNFLYKLYVTTNINFPFLFIDSDAFIIDSLDDLKKIFENTKDSVFFINHENNIPKQTDIFPNFINSGVFIMNDPEHFVYNWGDILKFAKKINYTPRFDNKQINNIIPGTDQAIIKSYLDYIGYDYYHKDFNIQYNSSACMVEWIKENEKYTAYHKNDKKKCKIVHYWGDQKKMLNNDMEYIND